MENVSYLRTTSIRYDTQPHSSNTTASFYSQLRAASISSRYANLPSAPRSAMAIIRVSYISTGLKKISQEIILEISNKKATHVTFHGNQIGSLEIKSVIDVKRLVDLDLSSNALHSGYSLTNFGVDKSLSLLGCCCGSLLKLSLQANEFTTQSFGAFVSSSPILTHLSTLDISHNNISKLPSDLIEKFPSLTSLSACSNNIKSLSTLLQLLHRYRGQLERLILQQKGSSNPVCTATLYREKVIFVLGDGLIHFDNKNISECERKQVRERLSSYSASSRNANAEKDGTSLEPADQEVKRQEHHMPAYTNDENDANATNIEHQVQYLSNLIEKQAKITCGLLEVTQHRSDEMIETCTVENDEPDDLACNDALDVQVDNAATIINLRRTSACALVQLALLKEKQKQSLLRLPAASGS